MNRPPDDGSSSELILASALFDEEWYARQVGTPFRDRRSAIEHYLAHRGDAGSPHPLFAANWVFPNAGWRVRGSDPLSFYLASRKRFERAPHPLLHLGRIAEADPRAAEHPLGPADHWLRHARPDDVLPSPRGALPLTLPGLTRRLGLIGTESPYAGPDTAPGRISVVLPLVAHPLAGIEWLFGTFREHAGLDVELLLMVPEGSRFARVTGDVACAVPAAHVIPVADEARWAEAADTGLAAAGGDVVVFLSTHARAPYWRWLEPLRDALGEGIATAQPLLLAEDHTIVGAGLTFLSGRADRTPLLATHAAQDAERIPGGRVPGVVWVAAMRTADARALDGPDRSVPDVWAVSELGVRAWRAGLGGAAVAPQSQLVVRGPIPLVDVPGSLRKNVPSGSAETWRTAGFTAHADDAGSVSVSPARVEQVADRLPRLRWTLDLPVTAGPWGKVWGDWYFGEALARALERLGQHVTLDPREARERPTRDLDDVVLVIRGRDRVMPRGAPLHALWVISHPDEVSPEEAAAFDLVFAASEPWSTARSEEWGIDVRPLLQCTDPERFHPRLAEPDGHPLLFVGNARGSVRPAVAAALEAGLRPAIYGAGWEGLVDPALVMGEHVDNAELGQLYASAGVVLNDHWDDMRRHGFVSNRVFDVLACGTRLVSDGAYGLPTGIAEHVDTSPRRAVQSLGDEGTSRSVRHEVARDHSFDARAGALVEAVARRRTR